MTLEDAKSLTLERQHQLAAFLPTAHTGTVTTPDTSSSLYECSGENDYKWPGVTVIEVVGEVDRQSVVDSVASEWGSRPDWSVQPGTSPNGLPSVRLLHSDGSVFTVGFYDGGAEFWVDAASPCFHLEGGLVPGVQY